MNGIFVQEIEKAAIVICALGPVQSRPDQQMQAQLSLRPP
jgi:hypothetical protein